MNDEVTGGGTRLDGYGGWTGVTSKATGFYHVEEIEGRWWFIDPDGNAFIALGIQHVSPRMLQFPWNRQVFDEKYGTVEKFYTANREQLQDWGFNCFGFYGYLPGLPYSRILRFAPISGYLCGANFREESMRLPPENYPDVFSNEFADTCMLKAETCRDVLQDWLMMGYWLDDVPVWDEGKYWITEIARMNGAGANRLVEFLRSRYDDNANEFNAVYGTKISSFNDVADVYPLNEKAFKKPDRVYEDEDDFMRLVARKYYEVTTRSIRRFDKNHIIMGNAYDMNTVGELIRGRQIPDFALEEAKPHVDVLGMQGYQLEPLEVHLGNIERWQKIIDKPVIITDLSYPSPPTEKMPAPFGPKMKTHRERGERHREYFNKIFSMPCVIGWYWCGHIDQRRQPEDWMQSVRQHSGLKNEFDEPHRECVEMIRETNRTVYDVASKAGRS